MELNPQQLEAIQSINRPLIVNAGPGTGKTRTLVTKIDYLISQNFKPQEILAITFTRKACLELKSRIKNNLVNIETFHSLAFKILKDRLSKLSLIDEFTKRQILQQLFDNSDFKNINELSSHISITKSKIHIKDTLVEQYNQFLTDNNYFDYDDLLLLCIKEPLPKFSYVLVDEFQDTNEVQFEILKNLVSKNKICVIGDANQSIYKFRGTSENIYKNFKEAFPDSHELSLTQNYRSKLPIINVAERVHPVGLQATDSEGGNVTFIETLNEFSEANFITNEINKIVGGFDLNSTSSLNDDLNISPKDIAILYRSHILKDKIIKALENKSIPYFIYGEGSIFDNKNIQVILNVIKLYSNCKKDHFLNIVNSLISKKDQTQITNIVTKLESFSLENLKDISNQANISTRSLKVLKILYSLTQEKFSDLNHLVIRIINLLVEETPEVLQFKNFLHSIERTPLNEQITTLFEKINDYLSLDINSIEIDAINLLTIHAAKGLEFKIVFIIGLEDDILPKNLNDIEEEQRILYVALTRAKEKLVITKTEFRNGKESKKSPFEKLLGIKVQPDPNTNKIKKQIIRNKEKKAQIKMF